MEIIDGKIVSQYIEKKIKLEINELKQKNVIPGLAVVLVGDDKPSEVYVNLKEKKCNELGIYSVMHRLNGNINEKELIDLIYSLNNNENINGILVQLPLPEKFDTDKIINSISPDKDVDGFHPLNLGCLAVGKPQFIPCTPYGVIKLLEYYNIGIKGKNTVIVGCSNIVGKPMSLLLNFCETATCTICHILTKDLKEHTLKADILISAAGAPNLIKKDMIKKDCVIIDVGFNVIEENGNRKICGDVDFDDVKNKVSYITPVPGGVGPMTITMLMYNTVKACKMSMNSNV